MRNILSVLLVSIFLMYSCSGDDNDNDGNGNESCDDLIMGEWNVVTVLDSSSIFNLPNTLTFDNSNYSESGIVQGTYEVINDCDNLVLNYTDGLSYSFGILELTDNVFRFEYIGIIFTYNK